MSSEPNVDSENPEWTTADFARARPASELRKEIAAFFPKTRGAQKAPKKVAVSIRLSEDVVDYFKATGPGWQKRIDETLKKVVAQTSS